MVKKMSSLGGPTLNKNKKLSDTLKKFNKCYFKHEPFSAIPCNDIIACSSKNIILPYFGVFEIVLSVSGYYNIFNLCSNVDPSINNFNRYFNAHNILFKIGSCSEDLLPIVDHHSLICRDLSTFLCLLCRPYQFLYPPLQMLLLLCNHRQLCKKSNYDLG